MNIIAVDISEVDIICHLWEELNDYNNGLHQKYFGHELGERGEHKRQEFRSKAGEGLIKFDRLVKSQVAHARPSSAWAGSGRENQALFPIRPANCSLKDKKNARKG